MVVEAFPPLSNADEDGLLAIGGDLDPESLVLAYSSGIFPWPFDEHTLAWFSPPTRAILVLDELHISRRLKEKLRQGRFHYKINGNFAAVIRACAESKNRKGQLGTWITDDMVNAYIELNRIGLCDSFEAYSGERLVGGLYGIRMKRFFAAESSFYLESDASKGAMCFMAETLRSTGVEWVDCQVLTPFSRSFGAREIPRDDYLLLLKKALLAVIFLVVGSLNAMVVQTASADPIWRCGEVFSSTYHDGCSELNTGMAKGITGERVFTKSRSDKISQTGEADRIDDANAPAGNEPPEDPRISGTLFQTKDTGKLASSGGTASSADPNIGIPSDPVAALAFIRCISEAFKGNKTEAAKCGLPNLDFSQVTDALK